MLKQLPSAEKIARMNRRQRKKLRVGEFQELVFEMQIQFHQPLADEKFDIFLDEFIALVESRALVIYGFGGSLPIQATDGIVATEKRGSPTEEDRQALLAWLRQQPEVTKAETGEFFDVHYGWPDD